MLRFVQTFLEIPPYQRIIQGIFMHHWQHYLISGLSLLFLITPAVQAAPTMALGYQPKYQADFTHFDYVNPNAPQGGHLDLYSLGNFDNLNPFILKGVPAEGIGELMVETLMTRSLDEPFSMYALLAEDISLAKDGLSVTFRLNPAAQFSDGSPVTAKDVKFSFDTLKSDAAHPRYRIYWNDIREAELIDKRTVKFHFTKKNPELHLIASELPVFSKKALAGKVFEEVVTEPLVASGPYILEDYEKGKNITFKKNPDYWAEDLNSRRGMFNFETITIKYYKDSSIALEALKSGEFDVMTAYNSKQWARDYIGPQFDSGDIVKKEFPHKNNSGMQAFVFNLRKPIFQDIRVRKAINLAFDFQWANKNLFYGQYERCDSYFSNTRLAAQGLPTEAELALLKPLQEKYPEHFPDKALTEVWQPVSTTPPHSLRGNLRQAKKLLDEAGWQLKDGVLQKDGRQLRFHVMIFQSAFARILAPFEHNLRKLGIEMTYRTVDRALYQRRIEAFEFDMAVTIFSQSMSPGNELMFMWHSSSADKEGSENLIGLQNPVVDALIEKVIYAPDREALVTAVHALDRVMLFGEYVVPNWYSDVHRVAFWNQVEYPQQLPLHYLAPSWILSHWWAKSQEK